MDQHHECIPLATHVLLPVQEVSNQLGCVGDEEVEVLIDGEDSEDGVPPDVAVPVLEAGADGRHQRLKQLRLLQLAQEPNKIIIVNIQQPVQSHVALDSFSIGAFWKMRYFY